LFLEELVETTHYGNLFIEELVETNHYANLFAEEPIKLHTRGLIKDR
jgi:hypothetical protein